MHLFLLPMLRSHLTKRREMGKTGIFGSQVVSLWSKFGPLHMTVSKEVVPNGWENVLEGVLALVTMFSSWPP